MGRPPGGFGPGNILGDTALTSFMATVGRGAGFAVPFFVAAWFGVTDGTDAFFYVYGIILLLAGVFAPVVQNVLVPFVAEIKAQDEREIGDFLGRALVVSVSALTAMAVLVLLVARPVLDVVSDFSDDSLALISRLLLETIPLLILLIVTSLLSGTLNAYRKFSLPAVSPGLRAVVALTVIAFLKDRIGVHSIALGYVVGELVRCAVLLVYAARIGIAPSFRSLRPDGRIIHFLKTASYQVAGLSVLALTPIVDKTMASWLAPGSVSVLEYATRLYEIPMTFVVGGLFVVLLSHWSIRFYERSRVHFKAEVMRTAGLVAAGAVALGAALIILRGSLVTLLYGRGEFPEAHLASVQTIWAIYLIGLGPTLFGRVFVRAHLVLKNTKLLMLAGIGTFVMKVALNLAFVRPLGLNGLALSTTITESVIAAFLLISFLKASDVASDWSRPDDTRDQEVFE
jgi:putative peptidoglycan lipid II flippase